MDGYLRYKCLSVKCTARLSAESDAQENSHNWVCTNARQQSLGKRMAIVMVLLLATAAFGCKATATKKVSPAACDLALAPHSGNNSIDLEIIRLQESARHSADPSPPFEQLGWAYVQKARASFDQGFYKLAEQCAECIASQRPDSPEALLLKGYVLCNLHCFKEAEAIARPLCEARSAPFDYGLLGDALMEQGRLNEAIDAYQQMVDLKPGPQAYTRIAHVRWLKGDLEGAIEMMRKAAGAMGTRDAESAAWAYSRLALYELQAGSMQIADRACEAALNLQRDYAPALMVRARISLAQNRNEQAAQLMQRAATINPLPEYKWMLAESLKAAGHSREAQDVDQEIMDRGLGDDPRTAALFLTTRGVRLADALSLAVKETGVRGDVFTLDALAWALAATGKAAEARDQINRALAEGTQDARLFYHAGTILARAGQKQQARLMLLKAAAIKQMLLPTEKEGLSSELKSL